MLIKPLNRWDSRLTLHGLHVAYAIASPGIRPVLCSNRAIPCSKHSPAEPRARLFGVSASAMLLDAFHQLSLD